MDGMQDRQIACCHRGTRFAGGGLRRRKVGFLYGSSCTTERTRRLSPCRRDGCRVVLPCDSMLAFRGQLSIYWWDHSFVDQPVARDGCQARSMLAPFATCQAMSDELSVPRSMQMHPISTSHFWNQPHPRAKLHRARGDARSSRRRTADRVPREVEGPGHQRAGHGGTVPPINENTPTRCQRNHALATAPHRCLTLSSTPNQPRRPNTIPNKAAATSSRPSLSTSSVGKEVFPPSILHHGREANLPGALAS